MHHNHGFIIQGKEGDLTLREKPWPVLGGRGPSASVPARLLVERDRNAPNHSPYLMPLGVSWNMGIRPVVQADGKRAIIRLRPDPVIGPARKELSPETETCVPAVINSMTIDPAAGPYMVGLEIVVTADVSGSGSPSREWLVGGVLESNDFFLQYILKAGDVGLLTITLNVANACGSDSDSIQITVVP